MQDRSISSGEIFVMDGDEHAWQSLSPLLQQEGYEVVCFADGTALLASARDRVATCVFIEVRPDEKSGFDILKQLRAADYPAPIFVTSSQGDIPMAVDAIRNGASDFIETPLTSGVIVGRIRALAETLPRLSRNSVDKSLLRLPSGEPLTRRERDVLMHLVAGASNKEIAGWLNLSSRTVEDHRANMLRKAGVRRMVELLRLVQHDLRGL